MCLPYQTIPEACYDCGDEGEIEVPSCDKCPTDRGTEVRETSIWFCRECAYLRGIEGVLKPEPEECAHCYSIPCICDTDPLPADVEYERATRHNFGGRD